MIDREQVEVLRILGDVLMKGILALIVGVILLLLTIAVIRSPSMPVALVHAVLDASVVIVLLHYFPSKARTCHNRCSRR